MMGTRTQLCSGDEFDAFTGFRRYLRWRPGERRAIKQAHNQRERKRYRLVLARADFDLWTVTSDAGDAHRGVDGLGIESRAP